ncbi:hypothetical protein Hanom_Chr06g00555341 [Helianthus anomalus]
MWRMTRVIVALYVVAYKREHGKMTTVQKGANKDPWYHQIVRNFALPRDADLSAQPSTNAYALNQRRKKRAPTATATPKKLDTLKADVLKEDKRKCTRLVSDPWCDYVVVSNTLKGLAPVAVRKPKAEPRDIAYLPVPNPDDPIDMDSSPEPLLRTKAVKRKQPESEVKTYPAKKITRKRISKKGNLDAFSTKLSLERRKSIIEEEVLVITVPSSATTSTPPRDDIEDNPVNVDQTSVAHDEEGSPICSEQTLGDYYYRSYSEKRASEIHAPVWKLKQGDTFSDWQVCRDWLQGVFPPAEVKFQEERSHDQTYHSYLEETASSTSTTHLIEVADEKAKVAALRAKYDAEQAKFESDQKTEEWSTTGWKRKVEAEAAQLAEARKRWKEICEKDNNEKRALHTDVQTCATLALRNKEIEELTSLLSDQEQTKADLESAKKDLQLERVEKAEAARRLAETQEKLENYETARVTAESLVEPLKNDLLWMRYHGIINVANSILHSIDLDQTVANLMVTVRSDGYTQGMQNVPNMSMML